MAVGFDVAAESFGHLWLLFVVTPPPACVGYFAGKFIVCNGLKAGYAAKILNLQSLAAKYRQA